MLQPLDFDGALALLGAVVRQWLKDCRTAEDLAELAGFLGLQSSELARRLDGRPALTVPDGARWRSCPACGQVLPDHNQSESGMGRRRLWCSERCRRKAARTNTRGDQWTMTR